MKNILKIFLALAVTVCAHAQQVTVLADATTGVLSRPTASLFKSANGIGGGGTGSPGGTNGDFQYNNAGDFGGFTPGSGVKTFLTTPSSANLRAALTDKTGTGAAVFAAGPIFSGSVGIGSSSPQQQLHVAGTSNVNALVEQVSADTNSGGFLAVKARGTPASPDYPSAADNLFTLGGGGWNGSTLYTYNAALIAMRAYNTWSGSDNSTDIVFSTTPSGSTTRGDVFIMSNASIKAYSPIISTPAVRTTLALPYFTINIPADTGITAATEGPGFKTVTATRTWATTGTVALQRENFFAGPTYASASASQTFTDAFTLYATPPIAGTNAIFTRGHTLGIVDSTSASSSITGAVVVSAALGTTATSVGIGGGKINAGGNGTFGGTLNVSGHTTFEGVTSTGATGTGKLVYDGSPTLTTAVLGSSTATTQSAGDNSTKLATTAYADAAVAAGVTASSTTTLTNKRITARVSSVADATSISVNADSYDLVIQTNTQTAGTLTVNNPTGTPTDGQRLVYRVKCTNVQTFSFGGLFAGSADLALPASSSGSSKIDYLVFQYDVTATKWDFVGRNFGF